MSLKDSLGGEFFFIDGGRSIKNIKFYPYKSSLNSTHKNSYIIGVGGNLCGNLGRSDKIFRAFFIKLKKDRRFFIEKTSPLFINKAFGYTAQADFTNAVIIIKSSKFPKDVLKLMQHFEKVFKRKRSFKNAPRTLDLDILYSSKKARKDKKLILPHFGAKTRFSVIVPLGLIL